MRVKAYKAKDGSLHLKQSDQMKVDLAILSTQVKSEIANVADAAAKIALKAKASGCKTAADFEVVLTELFSKNPNTIELVQELIVKRDSFSEEREEVIEREENGDDDDDDEDEE